MTSNSRRGGVIAGLLITLAILVCIAVTVGLTIARNVRVESREGRNGRDVSIDTPVGNLSIHAHDHSGRALIDVPEYPGARRKGSSGGGAVVQWTSNDGRNDKGITVAGDETITPDSADQVLHYYQSQLPNWVVSRKMDGEIQLELAKDGFRRFVVIHEKFDGTHIGVASIGAPAAN